MNVITKEEKGHYYDYYDYYDYYEVLIYVI